MASTQRWIVALLPLILMIIVQVTCEEPYKYEKPLETLRRRLGGELAEQIGKDSTNRPFHRNPEYHEDQMAVEAKLTEEKVETVVPNQKQTHKIVRKRLPNHFPNFPLVQEVNDHLRLKTEKSLQSNNESAAELLPRAEPIKMSREESRLKNHKNAQMSRSDTVPMILTPQTEKFRQEPYEYEYYYDDDYYYDDYYDQPKFSKPTSKPQTPKRSFKPLPKVPPVSPRKKSSQKHQSVSKKRVTGVPPKMSELRPASDVVAIKRRLKNHRLTNSGPLKSTNKYDRLSPVSSSFSSAGPISPEGVQTSLEASPSRHKKNKYVEYDYYDDYEYYDDFVPSKPKRRQGYGGGGSSINPLALLVAPLAAISLLAAAAAVAINPVLVQVAFTGKRKKRSSEDEAEWNPELNEKMHEMQVLERFLGSIPDNSRYQQQILSMYLSCSGYTEPSNKCLDRVVCDYSNPKSSIEEEEKDVISIILYNIMANEFVNDEYKTRLRSAAKSGRDQGACKEIYVCSDLDKPSQKLE